VRLLGSIAVPALGGLVIVAPDFVAVVLGPKWAQVAPILQILAWVGVVQSLQSLNTDVLQALGRTSKVLRFTVIFATTHIIGFVIGLHWGVLGVATAYAITTTLVEPIYTVMTARAVGTTLWAVLRSVRGVFECGVAMMLAVLAVRVSLLAAGVPALPRLLACALVGAVVYGLLYPWRVPEGWADVRSVLGPRLPALGRRARRLSAEPA
jgi:O-antigen/teichoic acid export membrane protein